MFVLHISIAVSRYRGFAINTALRVSLFLCFAERKVSLEDKCSTAKRSNV